MCDTINPNDIEELDTGTISYITLKNGNMIMIDESVPQKSNRGKNHKNIEISKKDKLFQPLTISDKIAISLQEQEQLNNQNNNIGTKTNKTIEMPNNININNNFASQISDNTKHFSYDGKSNQNMTNNMPNSQTNDNQNIQNMENIEENNNSSLTNNVMSSNNEENKESGDDEAKLKVTRKSKMFIDKIEKIVKGKNKHTIKAVMSLYIPSDIQHHISSTQKHFDMLVTKFRQKQNKFRKIKDGVKSYKLYNLYKNSSNKMYNDLLSPRTSRIKYYEECENEKSINKVLSFTNINNLKKTINTNRHNIYRYRKNMNFRSVSNIKMNMNKSINVNSNDNKYLSLNESTNTIFANKNKNGFLYNNKIINTKLVGKDFGYSSALIFPSNRFKSKLNPYY